MRKVFIVLLVFSLFSCHSTRKIHSAVTTTIDTTQAIVVNKGIDSAKLINTVYNGIKSNHIDFKTFSAKIKVNYWDTKNTKVPELTVNVRMLKDSIIWLDVSANIVVNIEVYRLLITPDSVKVLNKKDRLITLRSVNYLQEVAKIPFDFYTLQDLLIGNPIYLDKNIVSYQKSETGTTTILSVGQLFKNLLTVDNNNLLLNSKLDDIDPARSRTCHITYSNYDRQNNPPFATTRSISVSEKNNLNIDMDFKQYSFNGDVSFPFSIPKNFKRD